MKQFKQLLLGIIFLITPASGLAEIHYDCSIIVMTPDTSLVKLIYLRNIYNPTYIKEGTIHTDADNNGYFEYHDEYSGNYDDAPNYKNMICAGFIFNKLEDRYYRFKVPKGKVYFINAISENK